MTAPGAATASTAFVPLAPLAPLVPPAPAAPAAPLVPAGPAAPCGPTAPFWFQVSFFSVFLHFLPAATMRVAPAVLPFFTTQAVIVEDFGFVAASALPPTSATRQRVATTFE